MKEYFLGEKNKIYYKKNNFKLNRQTIVFIHGLSGSSSAWTPYEKELENSINILSFDLRGHGKSFRPKKISEYSIQHFSEDLYKIIKQEKIKKFTIVSHSFGNLITFDFIEKHPSFVNGLILVSVDAAPGKRKDSYFLTPFFKIIKIFLYIPGFKKYGKHIDYKRFFSTGDWNLKRSLADINNTGIRSFLISIINAKEFDAKKSLNKIKVPTLIIHGKKDKIFPIKRGISVHNLIKKSKMKTLPNSNHIIVLNNLSILLKEIRRFMKLK